MNFVECKEKYFIIVEGEERAIIRGTEKDAERKRKNLQSTARERKFLSSKPLKETNPEAEIYEAINRIEFQFGKETHTVGEANLLFAYEVGLDLFTVYVIALSEHYGAIVFYLPEDLTRKSRGTCRRMKHSNAT